MENEHLTIGISSLEVVDVQEGIKKLQKKINTERTLWISDILLHRPIVREDDPYIEVEYYSLDNDDIKNREDYLDAARERIISKEVPPVETTAGLITLLRVQNPLVPMVRQDDIGLLLNSVIAVLNKYRNSRVVDFIYHDYINDDALHQPYIHIYLSLQKRLEN